MEQKKNGRSSELGRKDWLIWFAISASVTGIWFGAWAWIDLYVISTDPADLSNEVARGVFGDKFGSINALFSGLAFAGIIFTIFLQRRELALQRLNIEEQNDTLRQQRFESSFFHLLALHASIVDKLEITSHEKRDAFTYFIELLKGNSEAFAAFHPLSKLTKELLHQLRGSPTLTDEMRIHLDLAEISSVESMLEKNPGIVGWYLEAEEDFHKQLLNKAYFTAHKKSKDGLSHYFRNLYHIYRFIHESKLIDEDAKRKYARIVRAQLSDEELVAILYNCLAEGDGNGKSKLEFGYPKMTRLVQQYDILQNINQESVIHPIHLHLITKPVPEVA